VSKHAEGFYFKNYVQVVFYYVHLLVDALVQENTLYELYLICVVRHEMSFIGRYNKHVHRNIGI